MEKGRKNGDYPFVGAVASKYLTTPDNPLPGYVHITTRGIVDQTAGFLESKHAMMRLEGVKPPTNLERPQDVPKELAIRAEGLRKQLNNQFGGKRSRALIDSYDTSFEQAQQLMARADLFEKQDEKELDRYGRHWFGRRCLLAKTLLEEGVTCVKVTHHGYDTHAENFNFHVEQLDEFDKTFATLLGHLNESDVYLCSTKIYSKTNLTSSSGTASIASVHYKLSSMGNNTVPDISIAAVGSGSGASFQCIITDGAIMRIIITNSGSGYTSIPDINIIGYNSDGSRNYTASANATINGNNQINEIYISNGGNSFIRPPTIEIESKKDNNGNDIGSGAIAIAVSYTHLTLPTKRIV